LSHLARGRGLQLPPGESNPRARQLARSWADVATSPGEIVDRALDHFRQGGYAYTLAPPPLVGDPVDGFLFGNRDGYCEHYAGAFTFLMRAAGVPARVVAGYQGGRSNPLGDHLTVRQADAHAWSEVWLGEMEGWRRVDPTAVIAPGRVVFEPSGAVLVEGAGPMGLFAGEGRWLRWGWQAWDYLDGGWNEWVLGFGSVRQRAFFAGLGLESLSPVGMAAGAGGLVLLLLWFYRFFPPGWGSGDPLLRIHRRFRRKLARRGWPAHPWEGPVDYARRLEREAPGLAEPVWRITRLYVALRYGAEPPEGGRKLLAGLVRGL
ncbi:MAG: transglutaminase domain-containing protein, partial [Magnetococcales bacterium]|nr:transglutaminase domain-containing protein [Magnetococcales bacterium]